MVPGDRRAQRDRAYFLTPLLRAWGRGGGWGNEVIKQGGAREFLGIVQYLVQITVSSSPGSSAS